MPNGVALIKGSVIEYFNKAFSELIHIDPKDIIGRNIGGFFDPEDLPEASQLISEISFGGAEYPLRISLLNENDEKIPVEFFVRQLSYGDAESALLCIFRDLTVEQRFEEAFGEVEERYRILVENAPEAIVVYDASTGRFVEANEKAVWLFGLEKSAIFRVGFVELSADYQKQKESFLESLQQQIQRTLDGEVVEFEWACLGSGGKEIPCEVRLVQLPATGRNLIRCSLIDITERKQAEDRLVHEALYDSLTGLPNRLLIMDRLEVAVRRSLTELNYHFAVLFLDIDRFKKINDSLGHVVGDQLLDVIARRLEECVGPEDVVARFAGDEFTILIDNVTNPRYPIDVAEKILAALSEPYFLANQELYITTSIGIVFSSQGYNKPENLLQDADSAMYVAKGKGKARYEVFDARVHARAVDLLSLEIELRKALEEEEFLLYYEPIVAISSRKVTGLEAFIRWQHPEKGIILPSEFIKHAEDLGIIREIDEWVLRTACNQFHAWQDLTIPPPRIAVNLSPQQIWMKNLKGQLEEIIKSTGISPAWLELELLETVLLDDIEEAVQAIQELKGIGVKLSLDDFGAVYSSLNQLRRLPIDILRIDRTLIAEVEKDKTSTAIVTAIVSLAKSIGLQVVAEGIETEQQFEFLRKINCDEGQGYYFGPPVPADEIAAILVSGLN